MGYIGNTPALKYASFAVQHFTTSATTIYSLDNPVANENEIALFINNVRQQPGSSYAYTASGTTLTLSAATSASDTMYCVFIGKAVQTVTPASGSVTNDMLAGSIANSKLANSSITLNGSAVSLGGSATVGGTNTPAFHAFLSSAQTGVSDGVLTKCQFNSEKFDTDNCYDNSTNYRFTPNVAGKYYVYSMISANSLSASNISLYLMQIRKNGSAITQGIVDYRNNANAYVAGQYSALIVDMNGTSDYLEAFAHIDSANNHALQFQGSEQETYFGAYRIIE